MTGSRRARTYYPIFADLHGRRCLVVGGGVIAQRKVTALMSCGAHVDVISPTVTPQLATYARAGRIRYLPRAFRPRDLARMWVVIAATDDHAVNRLVARAAQAHRVFANVVDTPQQCSFIAPAMFRRGPLSIAVSTGGASPTLAKRLRTELGRLGGPHYTQMLSLLISLRPAAHRQLPTFTDRKRYFDQLVSGRVFDLVRAGKRRAARHEACRVLAGVRDVASRVHGQTRSIS